MDQKSHPLLTLPAAIVIAGAIIAIAIIWVKKPVTNLPVTSNTPKVEISLAPITSADHILGNPNATIKIVEFSDTSCPFCKSFHPTMKSILDTYGPSGKVSWVYRHFPLNKPNAQGQILHVNAGNEAEATECAAALGGNEAFWKYINRLYEITPSLEGKSLDQKELPNIAKYAGLDAVGFNECLSSGRFKDKVEKQYLDGVNTGVSGTPSSIFVLSNPAPKNMDSIIADLILKLRVPIMISDNRMKIFMSGALPEDALKVVIEGVLAGEK